MKPRDLKLKKDVLRLVHTRKVLRALAESLSTLEVVECDMLLMTLAEEIELLRRRDCTSLAWGQAAKSLEKGQGDYGLERVGLLPP